jgi:hypothetical protein
MKYFLYQDNIYRRVTPTSDTFYQKTGVFGNPVVKLPMKQFGTNDVKYEPDITQVKPIKKHFANAIINEWYKNNREKWSYQHEQFKHLDYFEGSKDHLMKIIVNLKQYSVGSSLYYKLYHQGYVWNARWNPNAEAMMLYKGDTFHKYTSITNCAPVWNITQKCYV